MTRRTFVARVLAAMPALLGLGWLFGRMPQAAIPAPKPGPIPVNVFGSTVEYYDGKQWHDLLAILAPSPEVDREALARMYVQP